MNEYMDSCLYLVPVGSNCVREVIDQNMVRTLPLSCELPKKNGKLVAELPSPMSVHGYAPVLQKVSLAGLCFMTAA
jgi:hypothetical protein